MGHAASRSLLLCVCTLPCLCTSCLAASTRPAGNSQQHCRAQLCKQHPLNPRTPCCVVQMAAHNKTREYEGRLHSAQMYKVCAAASLLLLLLLLFTLLDGPNPRCRSCTRSAVLMRPWTLTRCVWWRIALCKSTHNCAHPRICSQKPGAPPKTSSSPAAAC